MVTSTFKTGLCMTPSLHIALSLLESSLNSVVFYFFHNHCTISQQAVLISGNQCSGIMWGGFCTLVVFTDLHQPLGYSISIVNISHSIYVVVQFFFWLKFFSNQFKIFKLVLLFYTSLIFYNNFISIALLSYVQGA